MADRSTSSLSENVRSEHYRTALIDGWKFGPSIPLPGPEDHLDPEVVREYSRSDLDDSTWDTVSLPHTVVPLSWQSWNAGGWEKVWIYRRAFTVARREGERVFLDFEGALTSATVTVNDVKLGEHRGGYLPFSFEITDAVVDGENTLAVVLDCRFNINVPPGAPDAVHSSSIDFFQPGGIARDVYLRVVPDTFVSAVAVTHHDALDPSRRRSSLDIVVDSRSGLPAADLDIRLADANGRALASVIAAVGAVDDSILAGLTHVTVELRGLESVELWDVDSPTLYDLVVSLRSEGEPAHTHATRTGYREAEFRADGFFLNGRRRYLMGVNRHEYFPFAGFAMPARVHRRDAEIIRTELNCLMVRCSHYPQSPAFLDACDELGLLVWEESPGWHYIGDSDWQDSAVDDITQMIARDRHRPSIVVWGARLNETPDRPAFYARTEAVVKALDPSRATSGAMHGDYSRSATFQHDVFSYDDYRTRLEPDGQRRPDLLAPTDDRPYLVSESVAARSSPTSHYRRFEPAAVQQHQALDYANAHNDAQADARFSGLLAWIAFDYQSPRGNGHRGVRSTGLLDMFRVMKPGAAIYRSQVAPGTRVVVEPAFAWDPPQFGNASGYEGRPENRNWGPGANAMVCSNCDRLEFFLGEEKVAVAYPDRTGFPHLLHAPSFADLSLGERSTELRIDGYLGDVLAISKRYSGDRSGDFLSITADDADLVADGADATRVEIMIADRYGNPRSTTRSQATVELSGPAILVGESTLCLDETGAVGAVWVRSVAGQAGTVIIRVASDGFGSDAVSITTRLPAPAEP